jgi:hypothetical protein
MLHRRDYAAGRVTPCMLPEAAVKALRLVAAAAWPRLSEHASELCQLFGKMLGLGARGPCSAKELAAGAASLAAAAACAAAAAFTTVPACDAANRSAAAATPRVVTPSLSVSTLSR